MQSLRRIMASVGLVALLTLLLPLTATAHERREVADGQYEITIGFIEEPAFVGERNGLFLRVMKTGAPRDATPAAGGEEGTPVVGLFETLQAEVIYGDQTMALPLTPAFREPGVYQSYFFPMAEGDYTYHIFGEIEGTEIDESFTSSPEGFDSVQAREPLEFPKADSASTSSGAVAGSMVGGGSNDGGAGGLNGSGGLLVALAGLAGYMLMQRRGVIGRRETHIAAKPNVQR